MIWSVFWVVDWGRGRGGERDEGFKISYLFGIECGLERGNGGNMYVLDCSKSRRTPDRFLGEIDRGVVVGAYE